MSDIEIQMHMRVIDARGDAVNIGPDKDGLGLVEIDGGENFGVLIVTTEIAMALATAVARVATALRAQE